jgi:pyruvate/2-oxoglutarate dehydrogenase complex dihydrolipoamide dehydrogenase (E3) component
MDKVTELKTAIQEANKKPVILAAGEIKKAVGLAVDCIEHQQQLLEAADRRVASLVRLAEEQDEKITELASLVSRIADSLLTVSMELKKRGMLSHG